MTARLQLDLGRLETLVARAARLAAIVNLISMLEVSAGVTYVDKVVDLRVEGSSTAKSLRKSVRYQVQVGKERK